MKLPLRLLLCQSVWSAPLHTLQKNMPFKSLNIFKMLLWPENPAAKAALRARNIESYGQNHWESIFRSEIRIFEKKQNLTSFNNFVKF